jgi:hypothetical protein
MLKNANVYWVLLFVIATFSADKPEFYPEYLSIMFWCLISAIYVHFSSWRKEKEMVMDDEDT